MLAFLTEASLMSRALPADEIRRRSDLLQFGGFRREMRKLVGVRYRSIALPFLAIIP